MSQKDSGCRVSVVKNIDISINIDTEISELGTNTNFPKYHTPILAELSLSLLSKGALTNTTRDRQCLSRGSSHSL